MALCGGCHALTPGADSPRARAPGFASVEMRHTASLDRRVADLTRLGHEGMPPVSVSPDQAADIVAYIQSFEGLDAQGRAKRRPRDPAGHDAP